MFTCSSGRSSFDMCLSYTKRLVEGFSLQAYKYGAWGVKFGSGPVSEPVCDALELACPGGCLDFVFR